MGIFGWSLPPGCTMRHIEEAAGVDAPCDVCKNPVDDCICSECPVCGVAGEPKCYEEHGMQLTKPQKINQAIARVEELKQQVADAEYYLDWLKSEVETEA